MAALVSSMALGIRAESEPPAPSVHDVSEDPDLPGLPNTLESALSAFGADAEFDQRHRCEEQCRREATGMRHVGQIAVGDVLRQSTDELSIEFGRRVFVAIDACIVGRFGEPEIRRHVDHVDAIYLGCVEQFRDQRGADAVRCGGEHRDPFPRQSFLNFGATEKMLTADAVLEEGKHRGDGRARPALRHHAGDFHARMIGDQPDQFAGDVPGTTQDDCRRFACHGIHGVATCIPM